MFTRISDLFNRVTRSGKYCRHRHWDEVREYDQDYASGFKGDSRIILVGWECSRCGLFVRRKEGPPWEVCRMCGGDEMSKWNYRSSPFEQIRMGYIYRCHHCGHQYVKTVMERE